MLEGNKFELQAELPTIAVLKVSWIMFNSLWIKMKPIYIAGNSIIEASQECLRTRVLRSLEASFCAQLLPE